MQPTFYDYYGAGGRYGGVYGYNDQRYGYAPAYQQGIYIFHLLYDMLLHRHGTMVQ